MQALENDEMTVKKVYLGMVLLYENKKDHSPIQTTAVRRIHDQYKN